MAKRGKNYRESVKQYDKYELHEVGQAFDIVIQTAKAKFDETVEVHARMGVDGRHADQQVRGAIVLPHGTGKTKRVLVLPRARRHTKPKPPEQTTGAEGWPKNPKKLVQFDVAVATPDMMVSSGDWENPRTQGLMPTPNPGPSRWT